MGLSATPSTCLVTLLGLFVVCVLSRMSLSESPLGAHGKQQMVRTVKRLTAEAQSQMAISRQDTDPVVALMHNAEAAGCIKAAKRLAEESGTVRVCQVDFLDLAAEVAQDQDSLLHEMALRLKR